MTILEGLRLVNLALFALTAVLFGTVNWMRRDVTDRWDAMARIGSEALFICLGYAAFEAAARGVPTGPRILPITACLLLIVIAYVALLAREIRKRRRDRDDFEDYRNGWPPKA